LLKNNTKYDLEEKFQEFLRQSYKIKVGENGSLTVQELLKEVNGIEVIYVKKSRKIYWWSGTYYPKDTGRKTIPPKSIRIRLNRDAEVYEQVDKYYDDMYSAFFEGLGHELYHHFEREHLREQGWSHKKADEWSEKFRNFYHQNIRGKEQ